MSSWFEKSTESLILSQNSSNFKSKLVKALNIKYGNYNYKTDARNTVGNSFTDTFSSLVKEHIQSSTVVCGSNDGYELKFLKSNRITAVDLSNKALARVKRSYPYVFTVQADIGELPFPDDSFDLFIAMRTICSRYVNFYSALEESLRVTKQKATLLISIPNGYLVDGKLIKGMYDSRLKLMDEELPYKLVSKIVNFFKQKGVKTVTLEIASEIIVKAIKE